MHRLRFIVVVLFCWSAFLLAQEPRTMAVLDFDSFGISKQETQVLAGRLRSHLVESGVFYVIERGQMMAILEEQDFQMTGCTTDECAVEVGQLLGAELMLAGSIGKIGDTYTIDVRVIDIETGRITKTATYDVEGRIDEVLKEGMLAISNIIAGKGVAPAPPAVVEPVKPVMGIFDILSTPRGAMLRVDDEGKGNTPVSRLEVRGDTPHSVSLQLAGYHTLDTTLTVASGERLRFRFQLAQITSWLVLGGPAAARVNIDGKSWGRLPLDRISLPVGEHQLKVTKPEYYPYKTGFNITEQEATNLSFELKRKPKGPAMGLSLVVPGGGQMYHGHKRGFLYMAAAAALGYLSYAAHVETVDNRDTYNSRKEDYDNETDLNLIAQKRAAFEESLDALQQAAQNRNIMVGAFGGVWLVNVIDIAF